MSTQNLHMNVYSSFIYNCQNLEAAKVFVLQFVNMVDYIGWISNIKPCLDPCNKPHLVMV